MEIHASTQTYAIGIGSNRRHGQWGSPSGVVMAAVEALSALGGITATSPIFITAPIGPSRRRFANAATLLTTDRDPPALLIDLKKIERAFGRRPGRRWGARALDLDILSWSGGRWRTRTLVIPHRELFARSFVLHPLTAIAPRLRLPGTAITVRHLAARLTKPTPVHRGRTRSGP